MTKTRTGVRSLASAHARILKPEFVRCSEAKKCIVWLRPIAIRGLATAFDRTGREDEADALRDQLMAALPVEGLLAEAEALCHGGDFAEAEKICDAVLKSGASRSWQDVQNAIS